MSSAAIRNLSAVFTPTLMVFPAFSSHYDLLLKEAVPSFFAINQAIFNKSKVILINQNESNISIENVRNMTQQLSYGSLNGELQAVILLNIDQASLPAQNALLKILEEPPAHTKFFLTATSITQVLDTIQSRCAVVVTKIDAENNDLDIEKYDKLIAQIRNNSPRANIELAETYQNKQEAIEIITNILHSLHHELSLNPETAWQRTGLGNGLKALDLVHKNVNVKLVLAEYFLQLAAA